MIPTQRERGREADFVLVCPGAEAKFSLRILPVGKARVQALQPAGKGAAKGQKSCRGYRSVEQLPAPPLIMLDMYPCWACPHGSQRETNPFNIRCAKQSSTCMFLPKTPAPGVRDQLGACCAKTSKTKIQSLLSWSPTELSWHPSSVTLSPRQSTREGQQGGVWGATSLLHCRLL